MPALSCWRMLRKERASEFESFIRQEQPPKEASRNERRASRVNLFAFAIINSPANAANGEPCACMENAGRLDDAMPTTSLPRRKLIHHINATPLSTPLHDYKQYLRVDLVFSLHPRRRFCSDARLDCCRKYTIETATSKRSGRPALSRNRSIPPSCARKVAGWVVGYSRHGDVAPRAFIRVELESGGRRATVERLSVAATFFLE
jgi:hypothetical protein